MLSPRSFRARGDGIADDGKALLRWLKALQDTGGVGLIDRPYLTSVALPFHTGLRIEATDPSEAWIGAHPSIPLTSGGFILLAGVNGIRLRNLGFRGSKERRDAPPASSMLTLIEAKDVEFTNCAYTLWRHLIAFNGCDRITWSRCEWSEWGTLVETVANPGACQYDGGYGLLATVQPSTNIKIIDRCYFHDGTWHPMAASGSKWLIADAVCTRTMEGSLFGGLLDSTVTRCNFSLDSQRDCASNGMEFGGERLTITDNVMGGFGHSCIRLTDVQDTTVARNILFNAENDVGPGAGDGCICVVASADISGLTIEDNACFNRSGKGSRAIALHNWGGKFNKTSVQRNLCAGKWVDAPVHEFGDVRGQHFIGDYA